MTFRNLNILTIDLEDWYHPEYVRDQAPKDREDRVNESSTRTLRLLGEHGVGATFFVVGESVKKHPEILDEIRRSGHEIGFHGYSHKPLWELNADLLRLEIDRFNSLTGERCRGFRAPSFSLDNGTRWALRALEDSGIIYDSSIFPARTLLYGVSEAPMEPYRPSHEDVSKRDDSQDLLEFPLLAYRLAGLRVPAAGGFYLRMLPLSILKRAIRKMNRRGAPAVMFVHNWELDPGTPRLKLGIYRSFVTYYNIEKTGRKLESLLSEFQFECFRDYIEEQGLA